MRLFDATEAAASGGHARSSASCDIASSEPAFGYPLRGGDAIRILLAAARPFDDGFAPLRPLWSSEAAHRAASVKRLFSMLRRRPGRGPLSQTTQERRLAMHLAAEIASLEIAGSDLLPCSGPLREVARDLVGLFGPAGGDVALDTDVACLSLAAHRRRALVLLGCELITHALTHAFPCREAGRLSLGLRRIGTGCALLQVRDNGIGYVEGRPNPSRSVAGLLADLLEGDIRYLETPGAGTVASVLFPVTS